MANKKELAISLKQLNEIKPITEKQKEVFAQYKAGHNLFLYGVAGTGKTFIALYNALKDVLDPKSPRERVYIVRSLHPTRDTGFLPSDEEEKSHLYQVPYQNMVRFMFKQPDDEAFENFLLDRCNVYSNYITELANKRISLPNSNDYTILPELISKEPLGPLVRHGDDQWRDVVSWSLKVMIIAEELECDLQDIRVITGSHHEIYKSNFNMQFTGASNGIRFWKQLLSNIGAGCKELLLQSGAKVMKVNQDECIAENGTIKHVITGNTIKYGDLIGFASKLEFPRSPKPKSSNEYRIIGKKIQRLDTSSKINGKIKYATDIRLPGMRFSMIKQSPVFGGSLEVLNQEEIMSLKGVENLIEIPNGIAVVADSTWHAKKGVDRLKIKHHGGNSEGVSSQLIGIKFDEALDDLGKDELGGKNVLELEYETPYLSHAAIEPMNCTAHVTSHKCEIWAPTQVQTWTIDKAREITGLSENNIIIHTMPIGGGFGRRLETDFVEQALIVAKAIKKLWEKTENPNNS